MDNLSEQVLQLAIKTVRNEVFHVSVPASGSVEDLKAEVVTATSVAVARQRLIYRGRVLQDNTELSAYNIENGHTVHLVVRQEAPAQSIPAATTPAALPNASSRPSTAPTGTTPVQANNRSALSSGDNIALSAGDDPNTMEHIRQNLLTLRTLLSTTESQELRAVEQAVHSSNNDDPSPHMDAPGAGANSTAPSSSAVLNTRTRRFYVGQWVDVKDTVSQWLEATVMDINEAERTVFVHYNGWPERWDEWISFDSPRISPFRSRTTHSTLTPYLSPTPNVTLARAPITGANDVRTLLPEIARMFRALQPVLDDAAALAEQSLLDRPTVSAYTSETTGASASTRPTAAPARPEHIGGTGIHRRTTAATRSEPAGGAGPGSLPAPAPARIAPGMPWEAVGTQVPSRTGRRSRPPSMREEDERQQEEARSQRRLRQRNWTFAPSNTAESSEPSLAALASTGIAYMGGVEPPPIVVEETAASGRSDHLARARHAMSGEKSTAGAADSETAEKLSADDANDDGEEKELTEAERAEASAAREARLRALAQELCPIIDRFGRVLADVAPHLWELGALDASLGHTARGDAPEPYGVEATLLSLLRSRPPSPPPQRAYRTPIAMQTRIGGLASSVGGLGLLPGLGVVHRGGAVGTAGNIVASLLGDLALLGGAQTTAAAPTASASAPGRGGGAATGPAPSTGGGGTNPHGLVDIHIAVLQPGQQRAPTPVPVPAAQSSAAAVSNAVLQAQIAENIRARTELLSTHTRELNNYSVAIEEMLRRLGADPDDASRPASAAPAGDSGQGRATSGSAAPVPRRVFASTIRPGPLSSMGATGAAMQPAPEITTRVIRLGREEVESLMQHQMRQMQRAAAEDNEEMPDLVSSSSEEEEEGEEERRDQTTSSRGARHAGARDDSPPGGLATSDDELPDLMGSSDEEDDEHEVNEVHRTTASATVTITANMGEEEDGVPELVDSSDGEDQAENDGQSDEEAEVEEMEEPLDDLLPTLSFNELGQSLMDFTEMRRQSREGEATSRLSEGVAIQSTAAVTVNRAGITVGDLEMAVREERQAMMSAEQGREEDSELSEAGATEVAGVPSESVAPGGGQIPASPTPAASSAPTSMLQRLRRSLSFLP